MSSARKMLADSTMDAKSSTKKRKKTGSKRVDKKKKSTKKRKSEETNNTLLDLSVPLKPISGYLKNPHDLIEHLFISVKGPTLQGMLPEILRKYSEDGIKALCLAELEVMSKKRVRRIISGEDPDEISSSGTDDDLEDVSDEEGELADEDQTEELPQPVDSVEENSDEDRSEDDDERMAEEDDDDIRSRDDDVMSQDGANDISSGTVSNNDRDEEISEADENLEEEEDDVHLQIVPKYREPRPDLEDGEVSDSEDEEYDPTWRSRGEDDIQKHRTGRDSPKPSTSADYPAELRDADETDLTTTKENASTIVEYRVAFVAKPPKLMDKNSVVSSAALSPSEKTVIELTPADKLPELEDASNVQHQDLPFVPQVDDRLRLTFAGESSGLTKESSITSLRGDNVIGDENLQQPLDETVVDRTQVNIIHSDTNMGNSNNELPSEIVCDTGNSDTNYVVPPLMSETIASSFERKMVVDTVEATQDTRILDVKTTRNTEIDLINNSPEMNVENSNELVLNSTDAFAENKFDHSVLSSDIFVEVKIKQEEQEVVENKNRADYDDHDVIQNVVVSVKEDDLEADIVMSEDVQNQEENTYVTKESLIEESSAIKTHEPSTEEFGLEQFGVECAIPPSGALSPSSFSGELPSTVEQILVNPVHRSHTETGISVDVVKSECLTLSDLNRTLTGSGSGSGSGDFSKDLIKEKVDSIKLSKELESKKRKSVKAESSSSTVKMDKRKCEIEILTDQSDYVHKPEEDNFESKLKSRKIKVKRPEGKKVCFDQKPVNESKISKTGKSSAKTSSDLQTGKAFYKSGDRPKTSDPAKSEAKKVKKIEKSPEPEENVNEDILVVSEDVSEFEKRDIESESDEPSNSGLTGDPLIDSIPSMSKNQFEILELEMRARAIKAMLKAAKD